MKVKSSTQVKLQAETEAKAKPSGGKAFTPKDNLITRIKALAKAMRSNGAVGITAGDIMQQIVDNQLGFNLIEFCHQAGITVQQLKSFIERNPVELGIQHNPTLQKLPPTRSQIVTLSSANGVKLVVKNGHFHPVCSSCGGVAYAELPVCPYCATHVSSASLKAVVELEAASSKNVNQRGAARSGVIIDDGDVYVTEEDIQRAALDLEEFKKQLR